MMCMTEWTTVRNYKLWTGIALMALSVYLIVKLYDTLFLSLRVPIMAVEVDGSMRFIGSIHPLCNPPSWRMI